MRGQGADLVLSTVTDFSVMCDGFAAALAGLPIHCSGEVRSPCRDAALSVALWGAVRRSRASVQYQRALVAVPGGGHQVCLNFALQNQGVTGGQGSASQCPDWQVPLLVGSTGLQSGGW